MSKPIPVSTRAKSPQTHSVGTRARRIPRVLKATTSPQPLALSRRQNQSDPNPRITNGSDEKPRKLNNAAYLNTAEKAAECAQNMKSAPHGNEVLVRKARLEPVENQPPARPSGIPARPKQLLIATPAKDARCSPAQFGHVLEAEVNDEAYLRTMAPKMENQPEFNAYRFYTEAVTYFSAVQRYRFDTGDSSVDSTPPTSAQLAAFELTLDEGSKLYELTKYYLKHRHNRPGTINNKRSFTLVDYGVCLPLIPKGERFSAAELYSPEFIEEIVNYFIGKNGGAHVVVTAEKFLKRAFLTGYHGRPDPSPDYLDGDGEMFNTEKKAIEDIHGIVGPDPSDKALVDAATKVLGLQGYGEDILLEISVPPGGIKNARPASGKENGANQEFLLGATTPFGHLEIVTDRVNMAGIPGTDPNGTAPTVRILGKHGEGVPVYPENYRDIGERLIAIFAMQEQKGSPGSL